MRNNKKCIIVISENSNIPKKTNLSFPLLTDPRLGLCFYGRRL